MSEYLKWRSGDLNNCGSFQTSMFEAYKLADRENMEILQKSFPDWFVSPPFSIAVKILIGSVWVLHYRLMVDGFIEIVAHGRGIPLPPGTSIKDYPLFGLYEANDYNRTVIAAGFMPYSNFKCWPDVNHPLYERYTVFNQKGVFSY